MNATNRDDIQGAVETYLRETFLRSRADAELTSQTNLFTSGLVDSLGAMKLVAWIESAYAVRIPPHDLVPDNFQTVEILSSYLTGLLDGTSADNG